jgi:ApaG protein
MASERNEKDKAPAMPGRSASGRDLPDQVQAYTATTRGVTVSVRAFYLTDQSAPEDGHFVWAYQITIHNGGSEAVQLLKRTWHITNGKGRVQRVHGDGVVGEQPQLEPGQSFDYTSGTPLDTPSGFMTGVYHMIVSATGETFDASIPAFSLDSPFQPGLLH